jgi:hypothetical protein
MTGYRFRVHFAKIAMVGTAVVDAIGVQAFDVVTRVRNAEAEFFVEGRGQVACYDKRF